jgi:hypothetical protein
MGAADAGGWPRAIALVAAACLVVRLAAPCPTCASASAASSETSSSDLLSDKFVRTEAIKQQILSKLGFRAKPNISSAIPHEVLLETMRIVDDTRTVRKPDVQDFEFDDDEQPQTSEIISFAEPGELQS